MKSATIYAQRAMVDSAGNNGNDGVSVFLTGIDPAQIAQEFTAEDLLEGMEFSDIIAYVVKVQQEDTE